MLFKKKKPEAPPITDEAKYIAWFIEYSDKLDFVRILLNSKGLSCSNFVEIATREALRELSDFPNADALFERLLKLSDAYHSECQPVIDARGGLHRCPTEIIATITNVIVNIAVDVEILTKKYKHPMAIDLLNMFGH
jgi:hypothetical protein